MASRSQAQTVAQMIDQLAQLPEDSRLMVLAPVVAGRKGEQADLLEELRAQGFTRVRIDGAVHDLDSAPRLKKNVKHSVDVVIDRLRMRADARQRLAESLETALRHADGKAVVTEVDAKKEHLFSAKFSCPKCDYALPELEPRIFSFNNPMGACPRCDGLGTIEFFDPKRIVAHPNLSLASGAIRGWDRRNHFYYSMLQSLAKHYGFDIESPWEMLEDRVQKLILYGSGREKIAFHYLSERGRSTTKEHAFEGVIPNHERRYRETDSGGGARGARQVAQPAAVLRMRWHAPAARGAPRQGARQDDLRSVALAFAPNACSFSAICGSREQKNRSPPASCARSPIASSSWSMSASSTCRSIARPRRSPAARGSASGWRARSARA